MGAFRSRGPAACSQRLSGGRRLTRVSRGCEVPAAPGSRKESHRPSVTRHRPGRCGARARIAAQQPLVAERCARVRARRAPRPARRRRPGPRFSPWPASGCTTCAASPSSTQPGPAQRSARPSRSGHAARADASSSSPAAPPVASASARSNRPPARPAASARAASGSDQTSASDAPGCGVSNGSSASTSGERNHWRATPRCGLLARQPRGDRLLAVVTALERRRRGLAPAPSRAFAERGQRGALARSDRV